MCFQAEGGVAGPAGEPKQAPEETQRQLHEEGEGTGSDMTLRKGMLTKRETEQKLIFLIPVLKSNK